MKLKSFIVSFIILMIVWLLLTSSFDLAYLITGAVVSAILSLLLCKRCTIFKGMKLNPMALVYTIIYLFVFIFELIKSNLDVARRVLSPSLPINPGIVEVKTTLKSPMARMILTNSITLTPGTLTIDMVDDSIFIHWIDVKSTDKTEATEKIVKRFENIISKIYD
ncbi:MAG: Na+/H+ antiporter subunit E [Bacteroidales bacterium]|jgi:multicomponent Na+:H+ antiporter subunit E|nr:Na+/H+ antiporter subunit E [Bacteroidales bacterium]